MPNLVPSLPVEDVTRTVEFYRHVLGFELVGISGKGVMTRARVRLGDVELMFRSAKSNSVTRTLDRHDLDDRIVYHIYVEDVFALYDRIKRNVRLVRDLERTLFGQGEFAIEDVDGTVLSFSQPHHTPRLPRPTLGGDATAHEHAASESLSD